MILLRFSVQLSARNYIVELVTSQEGLLLEFDFDIIYCREAQVYDSREK